MTTVAAPPTEPPAPKPRPKRRGRYIVAIGGCVVAVVAIIVLAVVLSENVVYFRTVTEAVRSRQSEGTSQFRLAGGVVHGTIHPVRNGVDFLVTDGKHTVAVHHDGDPPELFKAGRPWSSRATGLEGNHGALPVRPHPDPARRRLRAAEGEHRQGTRNRREGRARDTRRSAFGAGASVVGITALLAGLQLHDAFLLRFGRRCVFVVLLAALAAAGVMEWALLTHDFSLQYVAENNATRHAAAVHDHRSVGRARGIDPALGGDPRRLPHVRRATSSAGAAADPLVVVATVTGLVVALFFFVLMLGPANPFQELSARSRSTAGARTRCCRTTC